MNSSETGSLIYGLFAIMLVGSSLAIRRLPLRQTIKLALTWVAIFGIAFFVFTFRHPFVRLWQHVKDDASGTVNQADGTVRLQMEGNHFFAQVEIEGIKRKMLVDSGASDTVLSVATAKAAGVPIDGGLFPVAVSTGNGTVMMRRATVGRFAVGYISRTDFHVLVTDTMEDDVVGMNFLSSLKSWRVERDQMVLNP